MTEDVARDILGEATDISRSNGTTTQVGALCVLAAELRLIREAFESVIGDNNRIQME